MKKFIAYTQRFLIIFVLIAYIFPYFYSSAAVIYHVFNTTQTVSAKETKEKSIPPLLNNQSKEPLNRDNVEKFADSTFNEQLKKFNVPGAVFAVVKDNTVLFEKGYGYSDIDKKTPVDPKTTVFRAASVSKLFTATAVMQLKEEGKVNLKEDVNNYLKDFKIKNTYSKPVTLENLLTHTGGFDERFVGEQTKSYLEEKPLKDNLISHTRPIIREPGEAPQYSNYGMSVAGYAVESVSGTPFNKYVEDNIFKPLNMNNSSFAFNDKILNNLSQGYDYKNGTYKKVPVYGGVLPPAGGLKTTADDMTRFMIAHLNNGAYENTHILNKDTVEDMHKKHFSFNENTLGVCYGFSENYINGIRTINHRGDDYGFHSMLYLIPDSNIGFFISTNGEAGINICASITNQFITKYCSQANAKTNINNEANFVKSDLKKFEGTYQGTRYPRNEIGKLFLLLPSAINIKSTNDALVLKYSGGEDKYVEIEPLLFKNIKKGDTIAFKGDKQGNIAYMLPEGLTVALEKIHWYQNPELHRIIFISFTILFLLLLLVQVVLIIKRKNDTKETLRNKNITLLVCSLNSLFLVGMIKECLPLSHMLMFLPELPKIVIYLLFIPIITTILTLYLIISTFIYWNKRSDNLVSKVWTILVCCIFLIFNLYLNYWNLFGFKFY